MTDLTMPPPPPPPPPPAALRELDRNANANASDNRVAPPPKRKRFEDGQFSAPRVLLPRKRVERSYSQATRDRVIMYLVHHRIHDPASRRADERGFRTATQREAAKHFLIPLSTITVWYRKRDVYAGVAPKEKAVPRASAADTSDSNRPSDQALN